MLRHRIGRVCGYAYDMHFSAGRFKIDVVESGAAQRDRRIPISYSRWSVGAFKESFTNATTPAQPSARPGGIGIQLRFVIFELDAGGRPILFKARLIIRLCVKKSDFGHIPTSFPL